MKKLTLKNYFLVPNPDMETDSLQGWLGKRMLHGKVSRARTRFLRLLNDRINEMAEERKKLQDEHAEKKIVKDKDGKETEKMVYLYNWCPECKKDVLVAELTRDGQLHAECGTRVEQKETTDETKGVRFKVKDMEKFQEKFVEYMNEDYVIDVTPATSETIYGIRDLLLETTEEFSGRMATLYDEWVIAFEEIK